MALLGECAFDRPSALEACRDSSLSDADSFSRRRDRRIRSYADVRAFIAVLLKFGGPAAVGGSIVAVIVDTVYGMFRRWARTHISVKGHKVGPPLIAHGDPSASIIPIRGARSAVAPILNLCPDGVFWQYLRCAVLAPSLRGFFATQTATAFTVTAAKIAARHYKDSSAFADASIVGLFRIGSARPGFDAQPHKRLPSLVLDLHAPIIAWG